MVIDAVTCIPADEAVIYASSLAPPASGSHSTVEQELRGVAGAFSFMAERGVDFAERVASHRFLSRPEMDGLVLYFGHISRRKKPPGERTIVLRVRAAMRYLSFLIGLHSHQAWSTPEVRASGSIGKVEFLAGFAARCSTPRPKDGTRRGLTAELLAHLRSRNSLKVEECGTVLGRRPEPGLRKLLQALGSTMSADGACVISFSEIEAHLLALLPDKMADAGGPSCRPLLVVPWGTFDGRRRPACPCMFETVKHRHVADALGGPLFRRLGLDLDGLVGGRTHSFRHWLVTEALRGGLSMADVASWCGKASRESVRTYDHRTAAEMRAMVRRASSASRRVAGRFDPAATGALSSAVDRDAAR